MVRSLRIEYTGPVYHITSRGNGKKAAFRDNPDRETFLNIGKREIADHEVMLKVKT